MQIFCLIWHIWWDTAVCVDSHGWGHRCGRSIGAYIILRRINCDMRNVPWSPVLGLCTSAIIHDSLARPCRRCDVRDVTKLFTPSATPSPTSRIVTISWTPPPRRVTLYIWMTPFPTRHLNISTWRRWRKWRCSYTVQRVGCLASVTFTW